MSELFLRYILGLACGVIFGLVFPQYVSWWAVLLLFVGVFVISELWGRWGFGGHWHDYRFSAYALYTGPITCALIGTFLGSGKVGTLLIAIGTLISR